MYISCWHFVVVVVAVDDVASDSEAKIFQFSHREDY